MITLDGTAAFTELEEMGTTVPPAGATPVRVTVTDTAVPPWTVAIAVVRPASVGGETMNAQVLVTVPRFALSVDVVPDPTAMVEIPKVAVVLPERIVTVPGRTTEPEVEASDTTAPDAGAGAVRVTVPIEELPPITLPGEAEMPFRSVEIPTPKPQVTLRPLREAERVADAAVSVPTVEMLKVVED